jgi:sarcosine oxidase
MPDVAIVGAGVMGLATARALRRAGYDVVVYEQFEAGHVRGSSHGRSRIVRLAYAHREWVELAREAMAGWRELEAESGERLLQLDGLIEIVEDIRDSSASTLETCGVPWQRLEREEAQRRFPVRLPHGTLGVFQPEAGIVRADRALAAFGQGIDIRYRTRVTSLENLDARCIVVTAGAWINDLVSPPLPVRVTRETVCYFRLADSRPMPALVSLGARAPIASRPDGIVFYALADPLYGVKAAIHHGGAETDPNDTGTPDPALVEAISRWAADHIVLASADPVDAQACLYTTTADERFILERRGRIVVVSACSGHGFKFAPAIGARAAALAIEALSH